MNDSNENHEQYHHPPPPPPPHDHDHDDHQDSLVMPGFRFHPTEEELVEFYLRRKVEGKRFNVDLITLVDLYRYDPWELPGLAAIGEKEWFFYVPRDRKYRNGDRPNRVTRSGYWKATGADRMIRNDDGMKTIGLKKTLVFYTGRAPKGIRTGWIMNEYRLLPQHDQTTHTDHHDFSQSTKKSEISLCRVHKRGGGGESHHSPLLPLSSSSSRAPSSNLPTSPNNKTYHPNKIMKAPQLHPVASELLQEKKGKPRLESTSSPLIDIVRSTRPPPSEFRIFNQQDVDDNISSTILHPALKPMDMSTILPPRLPLPTTLIPGEGQICVEDPTSLPHPELVEEEFRRLVEFQHQLLHQHHYLMFPGGSHLYHPSSSLMVGPPLLNNQLQNPNPNLNEKVWELNQFFSIHEEEDTSFKG